jgi:hypothetical protein
MALALEGATYSSFLGRAEVEGSVAVVGDDGLVSGAGGND